MPREEGRVFSVDYNTEEHGMTVKSGFDEIGPYIEGEDGVRLRMKESGYTVGYHGENKNRSLVDLPSDIKDSLDIHVAVKRHDFICAVDTNMREFKNKFYSVGCMISLNKIEKEDDKIYISVNVWKYFEDKYYSEPKNFEQKNWVEAIKFIQRRFPGKKDILMIVDCDLKNINSYNERKKAIFEHFFLPIEFTLVYSKCGATDYWTNHLLTKADKCSSQKLNEIIKTK